MMNFLFLQEWPEIKQECTNAEAHVYTHSRFAVILCRWVMENLVSIINNIQKAQVQYLERTKELFNSLLSNSFKN
jgi:hypothetical protein